MTATAIINEEFNCDSWVIETLERRLLEVQDKLDYLELDIYYAFEYDQTEDDRMWDF